jgi:hypothetical protein
MAHFAELDENNIVKRVIKVNNEDILVDGIESEEAGINFCVNLLGGTWIQTSYNHNFRKNYAGIDFVYDPINDCFIAPQPFPSWILDDNAQWQAPTPYPTDGNFYIWNEETLSWDEIVIPTE